MQKEKEQTAPHKKQFTARSSVVVAAAHSKSSIFAACRPRRRRRCGANPCSQNKPYGGALAVGPRPGPSKGLRGRPCAPRRPGAVQQPRMHHAGSAHLQSSRDSPASSPAMHYRRTRRTRMTKKHMPHTLSHMFGAEHQEARVAAHVVVRLRHQPHRLPAGRPSRRSVRRG